MIQLHRNVFVAERAELAELRTMLPGLVPDAPQNSDERLRLREPAALGALA